MPEPVPPLTRMLRRSATAASKQLVLRLGQRAELEQLTRPRPPGAEAPNREGGAVDRQRRDHHVDAGAIGEAGVDHRAELVYAPAQRRQDPLDRIAQLLLAGEADARRFDSPAALHIDPLGAVDHHLLDIRVGKQILERAEADGVSQDPRGQRFAVRGAEKRRALLNQCPHRIRQLSGSTVTCRRRVAALDQASVQEAGQLLQLPLVGPSPASARRQQGQLAGEALGGDQAQRLALGQAECGR